MRSCAIITRSSSANAPDRGGACRDCTPPGARGGPKLSPASVVLYKPALGGARTNQARTLVRREGSMQATRVAVQTFDHFAYPVDALVDAERFYTEVLEMPIHERRGLRVADVIRGTLPRTFMDVAGHRIGLFLGREALPPAAGLHGCPSVGLEITGAGLRRVAARLPAVGVPFATP